MKSIVATILPTAEIARRAWQDYGEVIVAKMMKRWCVKPIALRLSTSAMTRDPNFFLTNMKNGALFLGLRTNLPSATR